MRRAIPCGFFRAALLAASCLSIPHAAAAQLVIVQEGQPRATTVTAKDAAGPAKQKSQSAAEVRLIRTRTILGRTAEE